MESYRRVEKPKPELPISENEIRITTQGAIRNYISYATTLLQVPPPLLFNRLYHAALLLLFSWLDSVSVFCFFGFSVLHVVL